MIPAPDLSDPRVAAHLRRLAEGAALMAQALAHAEAAARQHAEDLAALTAYLATHPAPVVVLVVAQPAEDEPAASPLH